MSELSSLLALTIPLSWAAAVSPVTLSIFLIIMSMAKNPKLAGISFYLGAILVLLFILVIGIFLGHQLSMAGHTDDATMGAIDLFIGAILFLLGIKHVVSSEDSEDSKILKIIDVDPEASTLYKFYRYFIIGVIAFLLNFSTAIFVLAVGKAIGTSNAGLSNDIISTIILIVIALLIIEIPIIFFSVMPEKAKKITTPINKWINNHGNIVTGLFCIFIGIFVAYNGIGKIWI
jgi:threonine/homoserine/homoserine lactone efflux protein